YSKRLGLAQLGRGGVAGGARILDTGDGGGAASGKLVGTGELALRSVELNTRQVDPGAKDLALRASLVLEPARFVKLGRKDGDVRARHPRLGLGLSAAGLEAALVEGHERLAGPPLVVEVGVEPRNLARQLRAHLDGRDRLQRARRADRAADAAS